MSQIKKLSSKAKQYFSKFLFQIYSETIISTQTVKPHRDFLTGNFLLSLHHSNQNSLGSLGNQWQVTMETCVVDQNGILWTTGPKR